MPIHFAYSQKEDLPLPSASRGQRLDAKRAYPLLEEAGFDRVLVCDPSGNTRDAELARLALQTSARLQVVWPHVPSSASPFFLAQTLADWAGGQAGRTALFIDPGRQGEGAETHAELLARAGEFIALLRELWHANAPLSREGRFFRLEGAELEGERRGPAPLVHLGGRSGIALKFAGAHADTFHLPVSAPVEAERLIARVREAAISAGRKADAVTFALPVSLAGFTAGTKNQGGRFAAKLVEELAPLLELGVRELVFEGLRGQAELESFAEHVLPRLRAGGSAKAPSPVALPSLLWSRLA